jgi:hypothetical protein
MSDNEEYIEPEEQAIDLEVKRIKKVNKLISNFQVEIFFRKS